MVEDSQPESERADVAYWSELSRLGERLFSCVANYRGGDSVTIDDTELRIRGDWEDLIFLDENNFVGGLHLARVESFAGYVGMLMTRGMRNPDGSRTHALGYNFGCDDNGYFMGTEPSQDNHIYGEIVRVHPLKFMMEEYKNSPITTHVEDC